MTSIGIIANPASGKDIRRLVSHATVIDNGEKTNIVERIILGAQALGVDKVYIMADFHNMGNRVKKDLTISHELKCEIVVLDMVNFNSMKDTLNATEILENHKVGCIVTLGGDGTNRAVAKVLKDTPIIAVSTGTNNVYPVMIEGTIVGMAAAAVASNRFDKNTYALKDKIIEIYRDDQLIDIALVDAVISNDSFIGSKAIWEMESVEKIFVTRSHPASIGFSAVVGCKKIIMPEDDFGAYMNVNANGSSFKVPVAAGVLESIVVDEPIELGFDDEYEYIADDSGTIALDGEREIEFKKDQKIIFKISRNGPYHVDFIKALKIAQINDFFKN
ncbi:MAG: ATP-NAD kinase family protein [Sedimentibacter sp.]